ncbi:MAG: thioredoxin domain-containing protein [Anaerolineae bacterium]|nr:thioredoxin domain-containing protein [Anaerolineae bacterium]
MDIAEASGSAVAAIPTAVAVAAAPAECKAVEDKVFKDVPELALEKDDIVIGNPNAISTLVEYADFQCPSCAALHPVLKGVMPQISDTVKLVFRHFPLVASHDKAMIAARGGVAAQEQGKFNEYQDLLYTKQADWSKTPVAEFTKTLTTYAADLKLDVAKFEATLAKPETQARVDRDRKSGEALKVPGTPTLFLDGQPFQPAVLGNPTTVEQIKQYTKRRQSYKDYLGKKPLLFAKPEQVVGKGEVYEVTIKTSKGDVVVELDSKLAPGNVNSTVFLLQKGFYNNMPVLVNEPQFNAVLFGDPSGTGFATPGYDCAAEPEGRFDKPGVVGLFRSVSNPDNSGAQLVIAYDASPQLDGDLTVIGKVTQGLDIVKGLVGEDGKEKQDKLISTTIKKK